MSTKDNIRWIVPWKLVDAIAKVIEQLTPLSSTASNGAAKKQPVAAPQCGRRHQRQKPEEKRHG